ncbi:hypothetical protein DPMN_036505 [Dreissena polymorpha]|uniref:Uncharacterized protein n=1 Tax=Dreissena polymorpha TaxID=45954 RepID=A0A9D4MBM4_DREPO|nr:hypothetical protein DPMN_036505 [Dreissena polymorpha]
MFQAQFGAYDSLNPVQRARAALTIRVLRNQNTPVFNPSAYLQTIADTYEIGADVITLTATDADGVRITAFGSISFHTPCY